MAIAEYLSAIAAQGFKTLAAKLGGMAMEKAGSQIRSLFENFSTNFEPHLLANFERCTKIKTILNKAEPINLLDIYVNCHFKLKETTVTDHKLVSEIGTRRRGERRYL